MVIIEDRIKRWKDKLIDLTKRNRLINFRPTKVTTIKVVDEIPSEIFKIIIINNNTMEFLPIEEEEEVPNEDSDQAKKIKEKHFQTQEFIAYDENGLEEFHTDNYLQSNLNKKELQRNLFRIYSKSTSVMEEQGYNVLFLALGCVEWYESENSNQKLRSPLILIPVELVRKSVKGHFKLRYTEEPPIINPALLQKLQNDFSITLDLEDLSEETDPQEILLRFKKAIEKYIRWRVTNDIYLSLFSFAKFVMYKDIEKFIESLVNHPIIKAICGQSINEKVSLGLLCEQNEIEGLSCPKDTFQILDADSSQQQAILAIKNGGSLLIEGPPGTGKSQTIANIIAECLAEGKRVLFVSQKMAALEVVKRRLEKEGLGDFCLELHSRKTNKSEVIRELSRTFELQKSPDHSHDEDLVKLECIRNDLNNYIKELHSPYGKLDMTPFKAMGILSFYSDLNDTAYSFKDVAEWDARKFQKSCEILDVYSNALLDIRNPESHPWKGAKLVELLYKDKLELLECMDKFFSQYHQFTGFLESLSNEVCFKSRNSLGAVNDLIEVYSLFAKLPAKLTKKILKDERWNVLSEATISIIEHVKNFNKFQLTIKDKYKVAIIEQDFESLITHFKSYTTNFLSIFRPLFWKEKKLIKSFFINKNYKPTVKNMLDDLEVLNSGKIAADKIKEDSSLAEELFGEYWKSCDSDGATLEFFAQWLVAFRFYYNKNYFSSEVFDLLKQQSLDIQNLEQKKEDLQKKLNNLIEVLDRITNIAKFDYLDAFSHPKNDVVLKIVFEKISQMRDSIDDLDLWIRYQESYNECLELDLGDFIQKFLSLHFPFAQLSVAFKRQFLRCWLDLVFSERQSLKRFYGEDHERLIQQFREFDRKQIELAKIRIRHKLSGNIDRSWNATEGSELGILLRESRKKRAHKPLRVIFKQVPNMITALKPCLMMSPLTVAQFIDPNNYNFDVVIFDEASQIPPEDSIGSLMRGKQVVIAGDSKQLPPTSFFQSEVITPEDSDEAEEELPDDLDSILDECAAIVNFPKTMLRWHYRSRHESLIAFSNKYIYSSRLNTFPCSEEDSEELGIRFHHIANSFYDRGQSGVNLEEARSVARAVIEHYKEFPEKSLGVGTFNIRQKYAIEDAIEELLYEDNSVEVFFLKDRFEHFFVKNLEIIQGDERDVIFISVGYGKDQQGKLSMNFGPINKQGGFRRLNVLITRARQRLEIFSSIKGDDFDLSKTDSRGVHLFKKYLDFAEKGRVVLMQDIDQLGNSMCESPFEESVCMALEDKGICIKKQVGCSGYRIDLAVVDTKKPGKFILGIECDGANYHSCSTARDRDRLRQQILEDLGWNIHRIWSADWFKNKKRELEKILNIIEKAKLGELKKKLKISNNFQINLNTFVKKKDHIIKCEPYSLVPIYKISSPETFYYPDIQKISEIIKKVVDFEGPIHREETARRVVRFWGITSVKHRIREIMKTAENYCIRNKMVVTKGRFLWPIEISKIPLRTRGDDLAKDINLIAPEEIIEAIKLVLLKEFSVVRVGLINQAARVLGFSRVTENTHNIINKIMKEALRKEILKETGDKLILNRERIVTSISEILPKVEEKVLKRPTESKTEIKTIQNEKSLSPTRAEVIRTILASIKNKNPVSIKYNSPSRGLTRRKIEPYEFKIPYVKAYCHLAKENRTFRIDRIREIEAF